MYDYLEFEKKEEILPGMTRQSIIVVGDNRIHPSEFYGADVQFFFKLSNNPKPGIYKFLYSGASERFLKCIAKGIEVRLLYYETE